MPIEQAWFLKGWLLGQSSPPEVMAAVEAVIASLTTAVASDGWTRTSLKPGDIASFIGQTQVIDEEVTATTAVFDLIGPDCRKQRKGWSPEARAAQGERMRTRQAAKKAAAPGEAQAPSQGGA